MRKEGLVGVFLLVILSLSFASAGIFDYNPFKEQKGITGNAVITGQAVSSACAQAYYNCNSCEECIEAGNYWDTEYGCTSSPYGKNIVFSIAGCYTPSCTEHASTKCYNGDVYWYDSCGSMETRRYDCTSSQECEQTTAIQADCVTIIPSGCTSAIGNAQYCDDCNSCTTNGHFWRDSVEWCYSTDISGSVSSPGDCPPDCTSQSLTKCYNGDVYWYDSCGNIGTRRYDCTSNQECEQTTSIQANCVTITTDCTSADSNAQYCGDCNSCTTNGHFWGANVCSSTMVSGAITHPDGCDECVRDSDCGILFGLFSKKICVGGFCVDPDVCDEGASTKCYNGDVYEYDSCGERGDLINNCDSSQTCEESGDMAQCVTIPTNECSSVNSDAQYCYTCEACTGAGHYWEPDFSTCTYYYVAGSSSICPRPSTDFCTSTQIANCEDMDGLYGSPYCAGGNMVQERRDYSCSESQDACIYSPSSQIVVNCQNNGCTSSGCNTPVGCTSDNGDAQYCNTCEACTGAGHYWEPDSSTCTYYNVAGSSSICPRPSTDFCTEGEDCYPGEICVSVGGSGICVDESDLNAYNGMGCSDDGSGLSSFGSGIVAIEQSSFNANSPHVCAKGTVARNDAGMYFQSCEYGGQSANTGFWPGDVCDNNVGPGFSVEGICINVGWGSNYMCTTTTVCADGGAGNYYSGCNSCDNGDSCDLSGGTGGWGALCYGNTCFETDEDFECVNDGNCPSGYTCEGFGTSSSGIWGLCVVDSETDCFPCTDLGYASGVYCVDENGNTDVSQCSGCITDEVCTGTEICVSGECYGTGEMDEEILCDDAGGVWRMFENGCVDSCEYARNPGMQCTQSTVEGCDCGNSMCWNGQFCELNEGDPMECYVILNNACIYITGSECLSSGYDTLSQCQIALNPGAGCGDNYCDYEETNCPQDCIAGYSVITPPDPPEIPTWEDEEDDDEGLPPLPSIPTVPSFVTLPNVFSITGFASAVPSQGSVCGDGVCDITETTCSGDCPGYAPPEGDVCGDGYCTGDENYYDCPEDCTPGCSSHATSKCHNGDVYWYDSCGDVEDMRYNCGSNQYCSNGQCHDNPQSCNSHASYSCHNGDVYWYDSCGDIEEMRENCGSNQYCNNGQCLNNVNNDPFCGDGVCNGEDTCSSCPMDCGACVGPITPPNPPVIPTFPSSESECTGTPVDTQDCSSQIAFGTGQTSVICNTDTKQWEVGPCIRSGCNNGYVPGTNNNCVPEGTNPGPPSPPIPPMPPIPGESCSGTPPGTQDCSSQIDHGQGHITSICNTATGEWEAGPCVVSGCDTGWVMSNDQTNCVVSGTEFPFEECYLLERGMCIFAKSDILCSHSNAFTTLQECDGAVGICGNNVLDEGEICEGSLIAPEAQYLDCETFGFGFGDLSCNADCRLDASLCNLDCYDFDRGLNLTQSAKVVFNGNEYYDSCNEDGFLLETFCISVLTQEGLDVFGKAEKLFSCPRGTECSEGACVDKGEIPWFPACSDESDCSEASETCVNGKCVLVSSVSDKNYCENNVCFFDVSFENGINFEYGDADYFITYMGSSEGKVTLKVAEIVDRSGISGFAKIETKELLVSEGVNHVMGLAIEVLDADFSSAKVKVLQFSCSNEEICLGNFECSGLGVCASPGAFCIINRDCNQGEKCSAGICVDSNNQPTQETDGICKLKSGEIAYCPYDGKIYQVARKLGCKFSLSSQDIPEEEFVLGALEKKEFSNGISVKRDINHCGSQYLALRFGGGSSSECVTNDDCVLGPGICNNGVCQYTDSPLPCYTIENGECVPNFSGLCSSPFYTDPSQCQAALSGSDDFCDFGCFEENNCYPIGYRKGGKYCAPNNVFLNQKIPSDSQATPCDNSFECSSNLCLDGECISSGFLQNIADFFKGLFSSS